MDQLKCEHFPDFIFNSGILLDVAYDTTNIKCDHITSHMKHKHPHAVLTVMFKHVIGSYIEMCKSSEFEPLSESLLYRIVSQEELIWIG